MSDALTFSEKHQQDSNARKPKLVQVLRVKFPLISDTTSAPPYFVVSDGKNSVAVFLSQKLYPPLPNNNNNNNNNNKTLAKKKEETFLSSMPPLYKNITKGSLITIRKWYVTTTVECAGTRLSQVMNQEYVGSICLGILDHVEEKGCSGIDIIGEPENVNLDTDVQRAVEAVGNHAALTEQLRYCEKILSSKLTESHEAQSGEQSKEIFPKIPPSFGTMSSSEMHTMFSKLIKLAEDRQKTFTTTTTTTTTTTAAMSDSPTEIDVQSQVVEPKNKHVELAARKITHDEEDDSKDDLNNSQPSSQSSGELTKCVTKQSVPLLHDNSSNNNHNDTVKKTMTEIEDYFLESDDSESENKKETLQSSKNASSFFNNINDLLISRTQDEIQPQPNDDKSESMMSSFLSTQPETLPKISQMSLEKNENPATSSQSTENTNNTTIANKKESFDTSPTKNAKIANSSETHDEEKSEKMSQPLLNSPGSKVLDMSWASSVTFPRYVVNEAEKYQKVSDNLRNIIEPRISEDSLKSNEFRRLRQGKKRRTDLSQLALSSKSELPLKKLKKKILLKKLLENGAWFSRYN